MANFETELSKLMAQFTPQGGFGVQNAGQFLDQKQKDFRLGGQRTAATDMFQLDRAGFGRSVAKGFTEGTRGQQAENAFQKFLSEFTINNAQLKESQRQSLMQILTPQAQQRANRPSFISTLLGGALGLGAQALIPGMAGGGSLMAMIQKALGGSPAGQGFAGASGSPFKFKLGA